MNTFLYHHTQMWQTMIGMIPFTGVCQTKQFVSVKPNPERLKKIVSVTQISDFEIYQYILSRKTYYWTLKLPI